MKKKTYCPVLFQLFSLLTETVSHQVIMAKALTPSSFSLPVTCRTAALQNTTTSWKTSSCESALACRMCSISTDHISAVTVNILSESRTAQANLCLPCFLFFQCVCALVVLIVFPWHFHSGMWWAVWRCLWLKITWSSTWMEPLLGVRCQGSAGWRDVTKWLTEGGKRRM